MSTEKLLSKLGQDSVEERKYLTKMDAQKLRKWESTGLLEGLRNRDKPLMARLLENQAKQLLISEGTSTADIAGFQAIALPMVRRVFGNLLAQEICSVQPMSLPAGLVFWLDFTYDSNRAGVNNKTWVGGNSLYGDPVAPLTGGASATGGHYYLHNSYTQRLASGTCGIASSGSSVAWSTVDYDPELSAAVAATALFTVTVDLDEDTSITNVDETNYKSFEISGTQNANVFEYYNRHNSYNTTTKVLTLYYSGSQRLDSGSAMQVAYVKKDAHFASTSGSNVNPGFEYAFDSSDNIPQIALSIKSHPIVANSRKLKVSWTPEVAQDLNAYHVLDAESEVTQVMADQVALDIDSEILVDMVNNAATKLYWDRRPGFFVEPTTGVPMPGPSFTGNTTEWYRTLLETVLDVSNTIHRKNLRSGANFIVTSPDVCTILESLVHWRPVMDFEDPSQVKYSMGIEKVGSLANRFTVYKNPFFYRNKLLIGYKGDEWLTTGYVYAPYVPLIVTPTIYEPNNLTPVKGVMCRQAKQIVRGDFYGVVVVKGMGLF